jgi:UDP-GlcNAc:undecaprenyl-phosphate GlcNAc-1-phosphate transferase
VSTSKPTPIPTTKPPELRSFYSGANTSQKSATILGMTAPLMALSIPLLDTSLAIVRRFLRRQPIFGADRGHIHHRLLDRGLTPRHTALLLYGAGGIAAMFSLFMANNHLEVPVLLVFGVATWLGIQRLGFVEFDAVGRLMMSGSFRGLLSSQIVLESLKSRLSSAETTDEYWMVLESSYRELGFLSIHLCFAGRSFCTAPAKSDSEYWRLEIPLLGSDYVELRHPFNVNSNPSSVSFLADMLHETLVSRYLGEPKLARSAALGD